MRGVFVSYRKVDDAWAPALVYNHLAERFGPDRVFKSGDTIPAGADYADVLVTEAATRDIMLVLIGPGWLDATGRDGRRRLDDEDDWVRREVVTALRAGRHVVPLLLGDDVLLPTEEALPPDMAKLARLQHVRLGRSRTNDALRGLGDRLLALVPDLAAAPGSPDAAPPTDAGPSPTAPPSTEPPGTAVTVTGTMGDGGLVTGHLDQRPGPGGVAVGAAGSVTVHHPRQPAPPQG